MRSSMTVARALEVLGLSGKPSPDEIRRAYLRQVKQHPPERDRDGFQRVREAFDFLKSHPWLLEEEAEEEQEEEQIRAPWQGEENDDEDEEEGEPESAEGAASEAVELDGPSFPNAEIARQLEELNEALAHDDPVAGARAMVALYGRPAFAAGPVPPPLFCLRTFMVLVERESFEEAHALLAAFEKHAALHHLEAGFGAEIGARWRLAREVSALCDYDRPLAAAVARGLRTGKLYAAAGQVDAIVARRDSVDRLTKDAPTIWNMLVPLLTPPPQETPRMRDIGAWPFGVVVVVLINLMRVCLPSSSSMSSVIDSKPSVTDVSNHPALAPEGAPSFSPELSFRERAELQAEQAWKSLQASLERGDCQGASDQWPLYRVAALDVVDATTHASRKQRILEMCAELQPLLEDKP